MAQRRHCPVYAGDCRAAQGAADVAERVARPGARPFPRPRFDLTPSKDPACGVSARPGRIRPPTCAPSARMPSTVMAVPQSTMAAPVTRRQPRAAPASDPRPDAAARRRHSPHHGPSAAPWQPPPPTSARACADKAARNAGRSTLKAHAARRRQGLYASDSMHIVFGIAAALQGFARLQCAADQAGPFDAAVAGVHQQDHALTPSGDGDGSGCARTLTSPE